MTWLKDVFGTPDNKQKAIDEYNLGLEAKYSNAWEKSFAHNRRATQLNPEDEAGWWNFAIAATALRNWSEARRAWIACGVTLEDELGEVRMLPQVMSCVRLNPKSTGEVVWGTRIDPARIRIENVPLPDSDRLYGDIILNDGAQEGTRTSNGIAYPVFDELAVWQRSSYSTYEVQIVQYETSFETLDRLCKEKDVAYENWGTVRVLCAECSRGNPAEHVCSPPTEEEQATRFGFASETRDSLSETLREWGEVESVSIGEINLVVSGVNA